MNLWQQLKAAVQAWWNDDPYAYLNTPEYAIAHDKVNEGLPPCT
jgi:hypothetical protein